MSCARKQSVEALRDGRLPADEQRELERHLLSCPDCAAEDRALDVLQDRLRAAKPELPDELALRRLRRRVLEDPAPAPSRRSRPRLVLAAAPSRPRFVLASAAAAAAAAVAVAALLAMRFAPSSSSSSSSPPASPPVEPVEPVATHVEATDEGGARWSAFDEGPLRRIDLLEGSLALRVDRPPGGRRVVVRVPDGEIEDVGTEFHVQVSGGRTTAVRVDRGSVVLHLDGMPAHTLGAGETWKRPPPPPPPPPIASSPAPAPSAAARPASSDDGEEDRAYVEIVRLLREDRTAEARAAARAYMQRFPNGFRRAEVERVIGR
ncbi:MAG: zf-HC2 domain-containing protein [Labilithrix sp.]|nr:zf-HC2 domain-containing protein [Labilithrix sp.]MCW5815459.1 zf-HC2 domain-containing protein [Labilithrix sp.]